MNTAYITTSIPYVNARPHVGFALELVQADVIARWHRLCNRDTFFLTGADENALKNVQTAAQEGITTRELCDRNAAVFRDLTGVLNISSDHFIRTSGPVHHRGASQFWHACRPEDIYLKRYQGLYCVGCEDFYLERDLVEGRCPDHDTEPVLVEEQNYFFRLSAYQQQLEDLLTSGRLRIVPESRYNEALSFIRQGLQDFSISRISERSGGWGIPVPGDPTQTLYVWFEALTNYLTGLGYGTDETGFARYWQNGTNRIHVIGKNVIKFHAIYWPATLLSAGLPLPDTLVVHGFLTVEGQKISKSLGNAIDPFPLAEQYGTDVLRYYLLRAITSGGDGDFSTSRLSEIYTADLANGLGNLVRRLETLCERSGFQNKTWSVPALSNEYQDAVENYQFHTALRTLWKQVRTLNQHIETTRPWEGLKSDDRGALHLHLETWVQEILSIAHGLSPFLPETAETIHRQFSTPQIKQGPPLFPRIDKHRSL